MADTSKYQTTFDIVDADDDGLISPSELKSLLTAMGDEVTDARAEEMVSAADSDGDGRISLEELAAFMEAG